MCDKGATLKAGQVVLPNVYIAGLFPMEDFFNGL